MRLSDGESARGQSLRFQFATGSYVGNPGSSASGAALLAGCAFSSRARLSQSRGPLLALVNILRKYLLVPWLRPSWAAGMPKSV